MGLIIIAKKQIELENPHSNSKYIFLDTDLIITKIWFLEVYKKTPEWLDREILSNKADFYLLCNNDIEWIADPLREKGGKRRDYLFNLYEKELIKINANYKIIIGTGIKRFEYAKETIQQYTVSPEFIF